jgi:hypothetical protein
MKKYFKYSFLVLLGALSFSACDKDDDNETNEVAALTETEKEDLLVVREEEKLARDVYLYAYDKYGVTVFSNIANGEQTHMDKVLDLLEIYGIDDPAMVESGVFTNTHLQELYDSLTAQVDVSELEAQMVGATIEDLDIFDIEEMMKSTVKADILSVYDILQCGSRNHMRAFSQQISSMDTTYSVQYISESDYQLILSGSHEQCGQ